MANQTPSKRRKMGRDAYLDGADDDLMLYCNPWTNNDGTVVKRFDATGKSRDFIEGWNEAKASFEKREPRNQINDCPEARFLKLIGWPAEYYDTESSAREVARLALDFFTTDKTHAEKLAELVFQYEIPSGVHNA